MDLKLKYGPNFSIVDGIQTFNITNILKKGSIEVIVPETQNENEDISGIQFIFTRNGQPYGKSETNENRKRIIDFTNLSGNWNVEVIVYVSEYDIIEGSYSYTRPVKIAGVFKVIDNSFTFGGEETTGETTGQGGVVTDIPNKVFSRFRSIITDVIPEQNIVVTKKALNEDLPEGFTPKTYQQSSNWVIKYNTTDYKKLNTLIDFGNNQKSVIVNSQVDADTVKIEPYSVVLKTYSPIPDNIQIKQNVSIVKEISEPIRETIRLHPFNEAELGDPILRQPNDQSIDYINNARTQE